MSDLRERDYFLWLCLQHAERIEDGSGRGMPPWSYMLMGGVLWVGKGLFPAGLRRQP